MRALWLPVADTQTSWQGDKGACMRTHAHAHACVRSSKSAQQYKGQLGSHLWRRRMRPPHCRAPCPVRLCPCEAARHTRHCMARHSRTANSYFPLLSFPPSNSLLSIPLLETPTFTLYFLSSIAGRVGCQFLRRHLQGHLVPAHPAANPPIRKQQSSHTEQVVVSHARILHLLCVGALLLCCLG